MECRGRVRSRPHTYWSWRPIAPSAAWRAAETVRDAEGRIARVDLLLSRAREAFGSREHLVVELKRPSQRLRKTELDQLDNYVTTVVNDAQFNDGSIDWTFLLVGRECDEYVDRKRTSPDRPSGVVDRQRLPNGATYLVVVRPWSEIQPRPRAGFGSCPLICPTSPTMPRSPACPGRTPTSACARLPTPAPAPAEFDSKW